MKIRSIALTDAAGVLAFVSNLPDGEATFLRDDLTSLTAIEQWIGAEDSRRLVADDNGKLVGVVSVTRRRGWSSHVGEVRLAVDPARRRQGLGLALSRRILVEALNMGAQKVVVEAVADQENLVAMFTGLGFEAEALLSDHIRDREGHLHHLLVLSHFTDSAWPALSALGVEEELESH